MDIGKKIKELRISKMMTQTELAGPEITRNMLSRIENGAALPSVGTVIYLAERLGVPSGLLLSEDEYSFVFLKNNMLNNIKRAYLDNNYELCRDMCRELLEQSNDDEISLIMAQATYKLAEISLLNGKLYTCKMLLDQALMYAKDTIYNTDTVYYCSKNLFYHIRSISPVLDSDNVDSRKHDIHSKNISNASELCKYLNALDDIEDNAIGLNTEDIEFEHSLFYSHITAKSFIKNKMFDKALEILNSTVINESIIPVFIMYLLSADIETCAKHVGDYKSAYEYSKNKIALLENMLSEGQR